MYYNDESTTTNTSSTTEFPSLNRYQHELLSRIISLTPTTTPSPWTDLLAYYEQVLGEEGLSIRDQHNKDVAICYAALLKLGWQSGTTWREKWETIYATSPPTTVGDKSYPTQGEEGSSSDSREGITLQDATQARITALKAQLAGLTRNTPFISTPAQTLTRNCPDDGLLPLSTSSLSTTPARRTFLVQSPKVDYGGSSSDESSTPARTRPTFVSSNYHHDSINRSRATLSAPPQSTPSPSAVRPSIIPESLPSPQLMRMENEVMAIKELNWKRVAFEKWESSLRLHEASESRSTLAYEMLLSRKAVSRWRQRTEVVLIMQENAELFDQEIQARGTATLFRNWKHRIQANRRVEWEDRIQLAWEAFRVNSRKRVLRNCFEDWRSLSLEARALRFREQSLIKLPFVKWQSRLADLASLAAQADKFWHRNDDFIKWNMFDHWYRSARLQDSERGFKEAMETKSLEQCLTIWRGRIATNDAADKFRMKSSLKIWHKRLLHIDDLDRICDKFIATTNTSRKRNALNYWIVECAGKLLHKSLQQSRSRQSLQSSLSQWKSLHVTCSTLDHMSLPFIARKHQRDLQNTFLEWRIRTRTRVDLEREAIVLYNRSLATGVVKSWRLALNQRLYNSDQADVARSLFLKKRVFNAFEQTMARRNQLRWIERRRKTELREILESWRSRTKRSVIEGSLVAAMHSKMELRIKSHSLAEWTERVIDIRAREIEVAINYDQKRKSIVLGKWIDRCVINAENISLAESSWIVSQQTQQSVLLWTWLLASRRATTLNALLDETVESKERDQLQSTWELWRERYYERILGGRERDFIDWRGDAVVSEKWHVWKARTESLPAIQFYSTILKRRTFNCWKSLVPDHELVDSADRIDRERTLNRFLKIWYMRFRSQRAIQAANRFQALTTSSATPSRISRSNSSKLLPPARIISHSPPPATPTRVLITPRAFSTQGRARPSIIPSPRAAIRAEETPRLRHPITQSSPQFPRMEIARSESGSSNHSGDVRMTREGIRERLLAAANLRKSS